MKKGRILIQVLILVEVVLTKRDYDRLGIELLSRNFRVTVFDCCSWLQPAFWHIHADKRFEFDEGYVAIENLQSFQSALENISCGTTAVDYLFTGPNQTAIRKALKSKKINRAIVFSGTLPPFRYKGLKLLYDYLRSIRNSTKTVASIFKSLLPARIRSESVADIAILSGEACLKNYKAHASMHIWGHSFDYDIYLSDRNTSDESNSIKPYAVFLDQNFTNHSDRIVTGSLPYTIAENYFPILNSFFDAFEKQTGQQVVVAAHPRADTDSYPKMFEGRKILSGMTSELVRDASLVFGHFSTAISFVTLYRKPLVLLTSDDLNKNALHVIDAFRYNLKVPLINLSNFCNSDISIKNWSAISDYHYRKYVRLYIKKPGSPEDLLWNIFSNYLLNSSQQKQMG